MARDLTADFIEEISANQLRAAILTVIYFDSGTTYNWTGVGNIIYDGQLYVGVGDSVSFGRMEESQVVKATGTVMVLSGVKSSLISIALQEQYQGRRAEIFFAVLDEQFNIIDTPYQIFAGAMDVMEIEDDGQKAQISMTVENDLIDLFKARVRNYTSEDQKAFFPNDRGLDFIPFIQDQEIIWKDKA